MLLTSIFDGLNLAIAFLAIVVTILLAVLVPLVTWAIRLNSRVENLVLFERRTEQTLEEIRVNLEKKADSEKDILIELTKVRSILETKTIR
ncbi:hypothetical protein V9L05_20520 [Bernardetia sp. Wsw4-3y2]|uniref:hypothetical protein n=1 Tax=Bernardetia sp. Wsw4-3y2 TaxID=3127471 RepID=UPI0030CD71D1